MPWSCVVWRILVSIPSTDYHTNSTKSQYEIRYSGHNAMFLFSYYTLAGFAITRESGLTGTEIGSLSIGAISIDVTNGMRGGAFIDIWISKIIEWIDTDDPTWGNLDAEILEFFFLACWIPESVKTLLVDPESWALESKIQLRESGIPQEEISLPFVTVKRKEKWVILNSAFTINKGWNTVPGIPNPLRGVQNPTRMYTKPFQYFKKQTIWL